MKRKPRVGLGDFRHSQAYEVREFTATFMRVESGRHLGPCGHLGNGRSDKLRLFRVQLAADRGIAGLRIAKQRGVAEGLNVAFTEDQNPVFLPAPAEPAGLFAAFGEARIVPVFFSKPHSPS